MRSTSGRAPKWLRRPVAAAFGWGGQFAYIENDAAANKPQAGHHAAQGMARRAPAGRPRRPANLAPCPPTRTRGA